MRKAKVFVLGKEAGFLFEIERGRQYQFIYNDDYNGESISLTMPVKNKVYSFTEFPSFFDGLLPEGHQLEGLLKFGKIDRNDLFSQLVMVGKDTVGGVTVEEEME